MDVANRFLKNVIIQAEKDNVKKTHRKRRSRSHSKGKHKLKDSSTSTEIGGEMESKSPSGSADGTLNHHSNAKQNVDSTESIEPICSSSHQNQNTLQSPEINTSENVNLSTQNIAIPPRSNATFSENIAISPQTNAAASAIGNSNLPNLGEPLNKLDKTNTFESAEAATLEMKHEGGHEVKQLNSDCNLKTCDTISTSSIPSVDSSSQITKATGLASTNKPEIVPTATSYQTGGNYEHQPIVPELKSNQFVALKTETYGLGPTLASVELCVGQPVTVEVLEPISPWKFYVKQVGFGLDKLMEEIFSYMMKHGEDRNRILKPEKNMTCLAQYSQDGLYYRARVMHVYPPKDGEVPVEILYVDYGNREEGSSAHLRELPEKFTTLPTQAVQCALAKVAPMNKYNVWTEEDISAFTQFVTNQSFSCVRVAATEEGLPQLVDLFLYVPRPTVTGGQLYIHNTLSTVNIATVLINQGRARDCAFADQMVALHKMYQPSGAAPLQSRQAKEMSDRASNQSDTASSSTTSALSERVKVPRPMKLPRPKPGARKNKVMSVKSIVAAASAVSLEPSPPESVVKESGNTFVETTTQHKITTQSNAPHKDQATRDLPESQETASIELQPRCSDDISYHSSHQNEGKDKQTSSEVKDYGNQNVSERQDNTSAEISSTGNHEREKECAKLDVTRSTPLNIPPDGAGATISTKTQSIEDFLADLPVANIKMPNIDQNDDELSAISSDCGSINARETALENSSYRNIDLRSKCFNVMLSHVLSPEHFYVHIVSETVGKTLDNMMKNLNYHFEQVGRKALQKLYRSYTPKVNDLCCARFSGDDFFYRAVVTEVSKSESSSSKAHVFYLDFGDREWLPRWRLFPLPEEFKDTPPLALSCSLAYVKPILTSQESNGQWPVAVTQEFTTQVGFENPIQMIVLSGSVSFDMARNPGCGMVDTGMLKVFLVSSVNEEEVCVNMDLIRLGLATIDSSYCQNIGLSSALGEVEIGDWDPMAEDYLSIRNSYNIDVDDPGVATVQYKAQDEKQICKYFSNNSCWRGDRCPYRHVQVTGAVTMDREPVYGGLDEAQIEALLPDCDTCVAVEIATIINPAHFYIILPWGKKTLDALLDPRSTDPGEDDETLDELVESLQRHYGNMTFSQRTLVHYAEGELVVARFVQDGRWYRAKVLRSDDRERDTRVQVFYVDFGNKEWVSERDIKPMEPQFLHLPFQAIECFLVDIEPSGHADHFSQQAKKTFQQMTDGKTLVAYVKSRSWSGCLYIDLFDTSGAEDINIGKVLIAQGQAQVPRPHSETTLTSRSGSEGSLLLVPG
ncbi:tudor domain-containing protein 1-like [Argopecten irradians]|uniref:tudor domain-containing protein 1-like n=1 Tax=Argopecten irradians TaxID=31199 RepID=UPI003712EBFC